MADRHSSIKQGVIDPFFRKQASISRGYFSNPIAVFKKKKKDIL